MPLGQLYQLVIKLITYFASLSNFQVFSCPLPPWSCSTQGTGQCCSD